MKLVVISSSLNPVSRFLLDNYSVIGVVESLPGYFSPIALRLRDIYLAFRNQSLKRYARKRNAAFYRLKKGDTLEFKSWLTRLNPDLVVVYSMSHLLKAELLSIPKYGFINVHPSFLPKYRGPNPIFWQYYYMEKKFGVTIYFLDKGEDTGDIICQKEFDVGLGEPFHQVVHRSAQLACELLKETLDSFPPTSQIKQNSESPTPRARRISKEQYKSLMDFRSLGVEKAFHIIQGRLRLFNAVFAEKGFQWIPVSYSKTKEGLKPPGTWDKSFFSRILYLPDGFISFRRTFSIIKLVQDILP